jgi:2-keto-4-pentenoate hydratase/2-oxohepta-3-ene-1,7-dioic acid hydratase in catechol pathway
VVDPDELLGPAVSRAEEGSVTWCRFSVDGGPATHGLVDDGRVTAVDGTPYGEWARTARSYPLDAVRLLVPAEPRNFYAAGINFRQHILDMAARQGVEPQFPAAADIGYRSPSALVADGETICVPADATELVQYEGELVAVIGRTARNLSEDEALDCVLGYTIGNDVSERSWQRADRTFWRAKNTDTFKPMGPWIVTGLEPEELEVTVRLNDRQVAHYAVRDAIFGLRHYLSRISRYITLHPGDVLWLGTDGDPENMSGGDVVEVEIPGIGVLRTPVRRAAATG